MSPADPLHPTERRRWPRLGEELLIACRTRSQMSETTFFTKNLSAGGLMFEAPEPITPATYLEIELYVEIELYAPVDCEKRTLRFMRIVAQIRWTSEIPEVFAFDGSNRYKIGAAFDQIDLQDQTCLEEHVKQRLMTASTQRIS